MKLRLLILTFILTLVSFPRRPAAQDDFRFQPPAAPPLDVDFGDDDDDEMGDFVRPPGAPAVLNSPPPGGGGGAPAPAFQPEAFPGGGGGSANFGGTTTSAGKFRFKLVEGQFWQKGQKRQRGNETHVVGDEDSRGGSRAR